MSWTANMTIGGSLPLVEWPDAVDVARVETDEHRTYVPERTATIVKVPRQSHVALGHYECGGCGQTIDAGDRYCRKCGACLEGASE